MIVYSNIPALPNTGAAMYVWMPLAAFALIFLGVALVRAVGTFRKDDA